MNSQDGGSGPQGSMGSQQNATGQPTAQAGPGGQSWPAQGTQQSAQSGGGQVSQQGQQGSTRQAESPEGEQQGGPLGRRGGWGGGVSSMFGSRTHPFEVLRRLDEDMDRLFHQLWGGGRNLMRGRGADIASMWVPQVEVREEGGKLHVFADLPGLRREDVTLKIEGDQLVLQGERRSGRTEGEAGGAYYHSERSYGSFCRSIPLPEGVDPQSAEASFRDGVLDVTFEAPRTPQQQSRQIEIR